MSSGSGEFTNEIYDNCEYENKLFRSNGPFQYQMFRGAHVNCNRCQVQQPSYVPLIDVETELKGINRLASKCAQFKYLPTYKFKPGVPNTSISTFDRLVPISLPPEVCPDVEKNLYFNNGLIRPNNVGIKFPNPNIC